MKAGHDWNWVDQEVRYAFGDRDRPYSMDVWVCKRCGKEVKTRGSGKGPKPGKCPAAKGG